MDVRWVDLVVYGDGGDGMNEKDFVEFVVGVVLYLFFVDDE